MGYFSSFKFRSILFFLFLSPSPGWRHAAAGCLNIKYQVFEFNTRLAIARLIESKRLSWKLNDNTAKTSPGGRWAWWNCVAMICRHESLGSNFLGTERNQNFPLPFILWIKKKEKHRKLIKIHRYIEHRFCPTERNLIWRSVFEKRRTEIVPKIYIFYIENSLTRFSLIELILISVKILMHLLSLSGKARCENTVYRHGSTWLGSN